MRTIAISEFKARASRILDEIAETGEPVILTKRGKPIAEVILFIEEAPVMGKLAHTFVFEEDIVSPLGPEMWEACR